jgi:SAM-dependent methyltransferase
MSVYHDGGAAVAPEEGDARFLTEREGIVAVPLDRWASAQEFERTGWMDRWAAADDDRNYEHAEMFDQYAPLRGRRFRHAIELGCGPFTNIRIIAGITPVQVCTLLDPLIESYLQHPHCRYDRTSLRVETPWYRRLRKPKAARAVRRVLGAAAPGTLWSRVPVRELIASPIERMPVSSGTYDLVVMVNVIEHCFDVRTIFANVLTLLAPGGILVFADKYYDHRRIERSVRAFYDAGHPLRVDRSLMDTFMNRNFRPRLKRDVVRPQRWQDDERFEEFFFVGERT